MLDRDLLYKGVIGLAIGDALGVPIEFVRRNILKHAPVIDYMPGGMWSQPAGTWSDDTAMTLATIDALNKHDWKATDECLVDIMDNFKFWYQDGVYAVYANRFDIGNTCKKAIDDWIKYRVSGGEKYKCTGVGNKAYGNGSLMRILPCLFMNLEDTVKISRLTHYDKKADLCGEACEFFIRFVKKLATSNNKFEAFVEAVKETVKFEDNEYNLIVNCRIFTLGVRNFINLKEDEIKSSGYVIDTLEAALWSFLNSDSYTECVLKAINLGDDTDTVGAIAGGLAGIYYGIGEENGIPRKWIQKLRDETTLRRICFNQ